MEHQLLEMKKQLDTIKKYLEGKIEAETFERKRLVNDIRLAQEDKFQEFTNLLQVVISVLVQEKVRLKFQLLLVGEVKVVIVVDVTVVAEAEAEVSSVER